MKTKFINGDRVKRAIRTDGKLSGYKQGSIARVYGRSQSDFNLSILPGIFPEMYEIKWDDGSTTCGHLSTGIERVEE